MSNPPPNHSSSLSIQLKREILVVVVFFSLFPGTELHGLFEESRSVLAWRVEESPSVDTALCAGSGSPR